VSLTSISPENYVIGPALIYYRAAGVLTPWTSVGATIDDAVWRIPMEWAATQDQLNGVMAPVRGLDVLRRYGVEVEFTLPELMGEKLGLAIPGSTYTAGVRTAAGGTPLSTTTTAATTVGATTIALTAATNAAVGDTIQIDTGLLRELRTITAIASLNVSFRDPLTMAHASGVAVVESTTDGRSTVIPPTVRRQPASAYYEWALVYESGLAEPGELRIPIGISQTTAAEVTINDDSLAGIRVMIAGRLDEDSLSSPLFRLYAPIAAAA
jgi:hypothetical protein